MSVCLCRLPRQYIYIFSIHFIISVAESVYEYHRRCPFKCNGFELKIELESPTLQEYHNKQAVRISGLTSSLDPEKLKFYISALTDNLVTQICLDATQQRAIATFSQPLGKLLPPGQGVPAEDSISLLTL